MENKELELELELELKVTHSICNIASSINITRGELLKQRQVQYVVL